MRSLARSCLATRLIHVRLIHVAFALTVGALVQACGAKGDKLERGGQVAGQAEKTGHGDAPTDGHGDVEAPTVRGSDAAKKGDQPPDQTPDKATGKNLLIVTDPATLDTIARAGGDIGTLLAGAPATDNRALSQSDNYRTIATVLERDVRAIDERDPKAGIGIRGNSHRLFDWKWLTARTGRYDLIGVVYRIDRTPLRPHTSGDDRCGDVHMIYRLAYTTEVSGESVSSRLPMTVVVFLPGPDRQAGSCAAAARAWRAPAELAGGPLGAWMVSDQGPLGGGALAGGRVERVRVNMQSVRWPSAVRPDLGGHAEYILRSFAPAADGRGMRPVALENTPDIARLRRNKKLRAELAQWIVDNLDGIEAATAAIPEKFLTRRSDSVTPRGLSRRANRPFRQIFDPSEFADLALAGRAFIGSPEALVRRLDDMTCAGCHQSRTIAGFHLLGKDPPDVAAGNALAVYMSPHLHDEYHRRGRVLDALAEDRPPDYSRPFAERGPADRGQSGSRCGLGDPGFATWTCAEGLTCNPYDTPADDRAVGTCWPAGEMEVGDPCEFGPLTSKRDPHRDRMRAKNRYACADDAVCNTNRYGFPGGMCTASCADLPDKGACGVIAVLRPFNMCIARKTPFPRCLAEHVDPAGLRACGYDTPCRDDYICALTPSGEGACMPPYFLFQMRVDGHP